MNNHYTSQLILKQYAENGKMSNRTIRRIYEEVDFNYELNDKV